MTPERQHDHLLICDLDNTLVDYDATEVRALVKTWEKWSDGSLSYGDFESIFKSMNNDLWDGYRAGTVSLSRLRTDRFRLLLEHTTARSNDILALYYEQRLGSNAVLYPDARDFLKWASDQFELALVSDGIAAVQHVKLSKLKIGHFFNKVVLSEEVGVRKPDPLLVQFCLRDLGFTSNATIYMGDSLASDGACAQNAGVDFAWINRGNNLPASVSVWTRASSLTIMREKLQKKLTF